MTEVADARPFSEALTRLARVLWPSENPPGHRLRIAGPGRPTPGHERYAAVPSPRSARFLLPLDAPPRARARLLRHYTHLRSDRRRAQRLALAAVARAGLPRPRPGRTLLVADPGPAPGLRDVVADALGVRPTDLVLSVGVRPGGGPLTPTVTVVDTTGEPLAFVKVADRPETRAELDAEHDVLSAVRRPPGGGILVPAPMFRLEWGGSLVVGIEPLPLDVRRVGPDELDATQPYLDRLVAAHERADLTLADSPWTARLRSLLADLPDRWALPAAAALDAAVEHHGDRPLPHGLRHGDWSSWNLAWSARAGGMAVWDWEYSEPTAPLGLDRCNWEFAYDTSVRGVSMTEAAARLRALCSPGVEGPADPDLAELYLLDMAVRRAGQGADNDPASAAYADELVAALGPVSGGRP